MPLNNRSRSRQLVYLTIVLMGFLAGLAALVHVQL